jgi:hypothetical protein
LWGLHTLHEPAILRGRGPKWTETPICSAAIPSSKRGLLSTPRRSHAPPIKLHRNFLPCRIEASFGTDYRMRPETSLLNVFFGKIFCTAESSCHACLVRALQKARPHGVPTESSWWTTSSSSPMQARLTIYGRKFVNSFMQTCKYRRRSRPYSQVASSVRPTG